MLTVVRELCPVVLGLAEGAETACAERSPALTTKLAVLAVPRCDKPKQRYLNLHGNEIVMLPPRHVFEGMKKLETLYLGGNPLPLPTHLNARSAPLAF